MKKNLNVLLATLGSIVFISACGTSEHMEVDPNAGSSGSVALTASNSSVPGYSAVKEVFQNKSSKCHGSGAHPKDWRDYGTAAANKDLIFQRAIVARNMPPAGTDPLSSAEMTLIASWVKGGAPRDSGADSAGAGTPVGGADPQKDSPSSVVADAGVADSGGSGESVSPPAAAAQCFGCHGVTGVGATPMWPNLAGQKKEYIIKQLNSFRSGERKDPMMNGFAAGLKDEDIDAVAKYFSSLKAAQ